MDVIKAVCRIQAIMIVIKNLLNKTRLIVYRKSSILRVFWYEIDEDLIFCHCLYNNLLRKSKVIESSSKRFLLFLFFEDFTVPLATIVVPILPICSVKQKEFFFDFSFFGNNQKMVENPNIIIEKTG